MFASGKGGVGKTTISSAVALALSEQGLKTLIVSTDPAHSLGDALDVSLKDGRVTPIPTVMHPLGGTLWGLEIDIEKSLEAFKATAKDFDAISIAKSLGVPMDMVESLGLSDITSIFSNPPPGIDEVVSLLKIMELAGIGSGSNAQRRNSGSSMFGSISTDDGLKFDRIIIDTAPTGHTLRLLQLPRFLDSVATKVIQLKLKLDKGLDMVKSFFGAASDSGSTGVNKLEELLYKVEDLQRRLSEVKRVLKDPSQTQFAIVSIPTQLAYEESKRLLSSLKQEGIKVSTLVVNQLIRDGADLAYLKDVSKGQKRSLESLKAFIAADRKLSQTLEITEVPFVSQEVVTIYGLRYFHSIAHIPKAKSATNPIDSRRVTIFGGKGGVGEN